MEDDPDSTGTWLNPNKNSIAYDRLTQQFAASIATAGYEAAAAWMETIGNPEVQSPTCKEIEFKKVFASPGSAPPPKAQPLRSNCPYPLFLLPAAWSAGMRRVNNLTSLRRSYNL